jgi:hypothetical protein
MQRAVGDDRDGSAQILDGDVPPADVSQVAVRCTMLRGVHALETGVGADAVQTQQQSRSKHRTLEVLIRSHTAQRVAEVES